MTDIAATAPAASPARTLAGVALRYGVSAFGPLSIAAAHFIAALIFVRTLPPAEFGLVSFLFVAVPPFLSVTMALVGSSLLTTLFREPVMAEAQVNLHLKANLSISLAAGALLGGLMLASGAGTIASSLFAAYCALMSLRQFARCHAYMETRLIAVAVSDVIYSVLLLSWLGALCVMQALTIAGIAGVLACASALALLPFGAGYLRRQFTAGVTGWLGAYRTIWRDLTRWSTLGVVLTEMTANAHAYLVTLIAGPHAFALLAVGALFMRPVSLFLTALPEMERPAMARGIVAGDMKAALRPVKHFRVATAIVWAFTIALTAAILIWFPDLLLKTHYDAGDVAIVAAIWAAIMAVRIVRTPDGVLMQAAMEFKGLAWAATASAAVSLAVTLVLLLTFGPIVSLAGILVGDLVMMVRIRMLIAKWKKGYG